MSVSAPTLKADSPMDGGSYARMLPNLKIPTLVVTIAAVAAALWFALLQGTAPIDAYLHVEWWALAPFFLVGELCVVHVHFRRSALTLTLSEIPLVVGLLLASPSDLIVGQLIGAGIALGWGMRRMPLRLAFNLVQFVGVTCVAAATLHALAGSGLSDHQTWAAVLVATAASGQVAILLIAVAMGLAEGRFDAGRLPGMLGPGLVVSLTNAALALVGVIVAGSDPLAFLLLIVPSITVFVAYRAYLSARGQHARLEFLHEATRALGSADDAVSGLDAVLRRTLDTYRVESVEAVLLPAAEGDAPLVLRRGQDSGAGLQNLDPAVADALQAIVADDVRAQVLDPRTMSGPLADHLELHGVRAAALVPLPGETRLVGTLMLANRLVVEEPFRDGELRLLETLAQQAGSWLEHDRLEQTVWRLGELQAKLEHQAYHDPLTGLANRALFTRRVDEALAADSGDVAVLFLDLDEFKTVNDTLGHTVGDDLLVAVGERIVATLPPTALAARFGGDEYAVLLSGADAVTATSLGELVSASVLEPIRAGTRELTVHVSVGVADAAAGDDADELLRKADVAMYAAKAAGRMQVKEFDPALDDEVIRRHELLADLERAIKRREFVAHYQPIVDLATNQTVAVEALVRWESPTRGTVPPGLFIEAAEEAGLIIEIGRLVLEEACSDLDRLEAALGVSGLALHVNLSPLEFGRHDLVDGVRATLERFGVPPRQLVLEITETAVMQHAESSQEALRRLRDLGVRIALDDFGTGWSSLGLLREMPVDIVKIAKPFIDDIADDPEASAFVRMMLELFATLRLPVVSEGIELQSQASMLRLLRCAMGQGYLFAKPAPVEAFLNAPSIASAA